MRFTFPLSPQFLKLLEITGICEEGFCQNILKKTQEKWYQPGERGEFQERFEEKFDLILPLIEEMGLFDEKRASFFCYEYCLVLGGDLENIKKRFKFLLEEWSRGVSFKQLIFLTGQRRLDQMERLEDRSLKTETEMMQCVWSRFNHFPETLRKIRPIIVDAPPVLSKGRPTTESTVMEWLRNHDPKPGKVLSISSAPYIGYQNSVLVYLLSPHFKVDTIGCGSSREVPLSILIDDLAKWFLWETKRMTQKRGPLSFDFDVNSC